MEITIYSVSHKENNQHLTKKSPLVLGPVADRPAIFSGNKSTYYILRLMLSLLMKSKD